MNILALGLMALGAILLLVGIFFLVKNKKIVGMLLSISGLIAIAAPFSISFFLAR